jgi:hypothetical protein
VQSSSATIAFVDARHLMPDDAPEVISLDAQTTTRGWLLSHVYADFDAAAASLSYSIGHYSLSADPKVGPYAANLASRRTLERSGFTHDSDEVMRLHGRVEMVSRYPWLSV